MFWLITSRISCHYQQHSLSVFVEISKVLSFGNKLSVCIKFTDVAKAWVKEAVNAVNNVSFECIQLLFWNWKRLSRSSFWFLTPKLKFYRNSLIANVFLKSHSHQTHNSLKGGQTDFSKHMKVVEWMVGNATTATSACNQTHVIRLMISLSKSHKKHFDDGKSMPRF